MLERLAERMIGLRFTRILLRHRVSCFFEMPVKFFYDVAVRLCAATLNGPCAFRSKNCLTNGSVDLSIFSLGPKQCNFPWCKSPMSSAMRAQLCTSWVMTKSRPKQKTIVSGKCSSANSCQVIDISYKYRYAVQLTPQQSRQTLIANMSSCCLLSFAQVKRRHLYYPKL